MNKIYLTACFILTTAVFAIGQQRAQYTQYMINPFVVNPAVSGTEDYTDIRAGYRKQWAGFDGSPRSVYLSAHTNIGKNKVVNNRTKNKKNGFHGIGFLLTNDYIGPTNTNTISLAYSYHLKLSKTVFASFGAMGGMQLYTLDPGKLTTANPGDVAITGFSARSVADINAGGWIYSNKFYAGASLIQVMPQKLYKASTGEISKGKLTHHYMIMAGYKIPMGYDFTFIPSICIKAAAPAPISVDINSKIRYRNLCWAGFSYRHKDAVAVMVGMILNNTVDFSYSYDYNTSHLTKFNNGSHEIIIGYRLRTKQQVICPSSFW